MNERIKELVKQAGGNPNYKAFRGHFLPPPPDYIDPATVDLEKFAELIVKDVRWVMQTAADDFILDENYDAVKGVGRCMRRVKQHFGVEE